MGSQPPGGEIELPVFSLLHNFTGKGQSSSMKRIFHTGRDDCGVDRAGLMTLTDEQHILCQRPSSV